MAAYDGCGVIKAEYPIVRKTFHSNRISVRTNERKICPGHFKKIMGNSHCGMRTPLFRIRIDKTNTETQLIFSRGSLVLKQSYSRLNKSPVNFNVSFITLWLTTSVRNSSVHDAVIKWKYLPRYWTFVRGIHRGIPRTKTSDAELWWFLWSASK